MALASVRRIDDVRAIPNADQIEVAQIGGWQCIVKKGDFKVGDLGVYFEIDSFLPEAPQFEFLRKRCFKQMAITIPVQQEDGSVSVEEQLIGGMRIRTMKMKGVLSQGLLLPLQDFFCLDDAFGIQEGDDVAEELGVRKFEKAIPHFLRGKILGSFPSFLRKTDQERVQNLTNIVFGQDSFLRHAEQYEVTMKLDGSSITIYGITVEDAETGEKTRKVGVCSRNLELKLDDTENTYVKTARESGILDLLANIEENIAFQGELVGPGIQKNFENIPNHRIYVFDIFNIDTQQYMVPQDRWNVLGNLFVNFNGSLDHNKFQSVPIIRSVLTLLEYNNLEELLEAAEGPSLFQPVREGLVFKSHYGHKQYGGNPFTFKVISNSYLLDHEE